MDHGQQPLLYFLAFIDVSNEPNRIAGSIERRAEMGSLSCEVLVECAFLHVQGFLFARLTYDNWLRRRKAGAMLCMGRDRIPPDDANFLLVIALPVAAPAVTLNVFTLFRCSVIHDDRSIATWSAPTVPGS